MLQILSHSDTGLASASIFAAQTMPLDFDKFFLSGDTGGNDMLLGGSGRDTFEFGYFIIEGTPDFPTLGVDNLRDFVQGEDKIYLDSFFFSDLQGVNNFNNDPLATSDFAIVSSDALAELSAAKIVYNPTSSSLFYNENGALAGFGKGNQFATLTDNKPVLTVNDFIV
jgi:Ca2+-binding RTX toxin-like protein